VTIAVKLLEGTMKVSEAMTRDVRLATPDQTICDAAKLMARIDAGALPVQQDDRLVGVITDRDIAVRAVAERKSPDTKVREVMSREVLYCYEDQDLDDVLRNMGAVKVRRLPVLNRDKRLVGIISLGDVALHHDPTKAEKAIRELSMPGGLHSQAAD
jgi:CBS domain-containing protein